jgi:hypothetical protein
MQRSSAKIRALRFWVEPGPFSLKGPGRAGGAPMDARLWFILVLGALRAKGNGTQRRDAAFCGSAITEAEAVAASDGKFIFPVRRWKEQVSVP